MKGNFDKDVDTKVRETFQSVYEMTYQPNISTRMPYNLKKRRPVVENEKEETSFEIKKMAYLLEVKKATKSKLE